MRTNRPNQGKFESWVSGRSAYDHPCALQHQTCSWKALWPPPRTAGGFFFPQLNFPGCILPYFFRADPPVAVISYIWGGQNPCPRSLNLKVWADLWNSKSGLFLTVLWFCEIWAFSVANQMHSLVSSFQPLKLGSLVTRPLAAQDRGGLNPCPLLPLLGSFLGCRWLHEHLLCWWQIHSWGCKPWMFIIFWTVFEMYVCAVHEINCCW